MKVYRYINEVELNKILSGDIQGLGNVFRKNGVMPVRRNSLRYKADEKYLHFYKRYDGMQFSRYRYKQLPGNFYFCTFNIPIIQLITHQGEGYYETKGYDEDVHVEQEFTIPAHKFKPEWLVKYELDKNREESSLSEALEKTR